MTNSSFKRLYILKGRLGAVGDDNKAILSFCLPGKDTKLVYFNIDFTVEEMDKDPEVFFRNLKYKIDNFLFDWAEHVRTINKKSSTPQD